MGQGMVFMANSGILKSTMTPSLKNQLVEISRANQTKEDPSHDFQHILRVTNIAGKIAESVGADIDVVIPAALFHDAVVYRKDSPQSKNETEESALYAERVLQNIAEFPQEKIEAVKTCIRECSFSKGIIPNMLESKVLQDADRLEATGAISIMRTFASCGQMNRPFYFIDDPFYKKTDYKQSHTGVALFYKRLLVVEKGMYTDYARALSKRRTEFLQSFLEELRLELKESDVV
jgi:uncharacterized protein